MGRPLNKKHFGVQAGNQIKVRAKIGAGTEGNGIIVAQKGTQWYDVTVGGATGRCKLVDKADGALAANEMTISVVDDTSTTVRVKKLMSHIAALFDDTLASWTYTTALDDDMVDMPEASDLAITVQPVNRTGIAGGATTFAVTATATPSETITYQWQEQVDGAGAFANVVNGGIYSNATTATLGISVGTTAIGNVFRCVVSSATGGSLTSDSATLVS